MAEINIPEVVQRFAAYYDAGNYAWGVMHIVLDDGNVRDCDVDFCIKFAEKHGDVEGKALSEILRKMSRTQRARLPSKVYEYQRRAGDGRG